jgi:hypothetical protein
MKRAYKIVLTNNTKGYMMVMAYVPNEEMFIHRNLDNPDMWNISHKSGYSITNTYGTLKQCEDLANDIHKKADWNFCSLEDTVWRTQTFQEVKHAIANA